MHAAVLMDDWADLNIFYMGYTVFLREIVFAHTKYRQMKLHHFWLFCNKSHIYIFFLLILAYILYIIFFLLVFVFFHFASYISSHVLYLGSIPFTFHLLPF